MQSVVIEPSRLQNNLRRTFLITGANAGIGLATAQLLAHPDHHLILLVRNLEKAEKTIKALTTLHPSASCEVLMCDLSSQESIHQAAAAFYQNHSSLDVLINNAGVYHNRRTLTKEGFEETFAVNHLAPFLLTHLLLPALQKGTNARIITVSSELHKRGKIHLDDLQLEKNYSGSRAYNQSKLANILFTRTLAKKDATQSISVNCLHPGVIATNLMREFPELLQKILRLFFSTPEQGAQTSVYLATSTDKDACSSGNYFIKKKIACTSKEALDEKMGEILWEKSMELTGL